MNRWIGKVAVVTGASSGIGASVVIDLANSGLKVIGLARRVERVEQLKSKVLSSATGVLYARKCDVSKENDITTTFEWIKKEFGGVDILINNAGILNLFQKLINKDNSDYLRNVVDTNVLGTAFCVREAFQSMKKRKVDGHIVLINSAVGHSVPKIDQISLNMYAPSKYAVTAMTEVLRQEFQNADTKIKITSISPGGVKTEMMPEEISSMPDVDILEPEDVSAAVLYALGTPPRVQVHELILRHVAEKS